jgi:opacity protein-like surface antigen
MRVRRFLALSTSAAAILIAAGVASAQPPPPPPPPPSGGGAAVAAGSLHEGVFVRGQIGFGYFRATASEGGDSVAISGAGPSLDLAGGFAVQPGLIIHGTFLYDVTYSPEVEFNGQSQSVEGSAGMVGIGAGITYYMMPNNMFFSGTLAMTQLVAEEDGETEGSEWGPGIAVQAGKEWFVAPKVGLGVAARFALGSQKIDPDFDVNYTTTTFSLLFSGTFN